MTEPVRELEELFRALRRRTASATPPFHATLSDARRRTPARHPRRFVAVVAGGVVIVLLAVTWFGPREPRVRGIDLAAARWRAPTDFLLQTPDADLLRTVPSLGTTTLGRSLP